MIIELFGLPASGKTTLSKAWEKKGWPRVRLASRVEIGAFFLFFCILHPLRAVRACIFVVRFSGSVRLAHLKIANLLVYNLALWQKSRGLERAVLDQGPLQMLLSLFEHKQPAKILETLARILPKSDLVVALTAPAEVRRARLGGRSALPRAEYGIQASERLCEVAEAHFPLVLAIFNKLGVPHVVRSDTPTLTELLTAHFTYLTFARMPTEKAHGVSIAHMCAAFSDLDKTVELVVPQRANNLTESIFEFYGVPRVFAVREIPSFDFLGRHLTNRFFFFLQRLLFMRAARTAGVRPGVVYTRDPELAFAFRKSHVVVYEAHRMPRGVAGALTARLVKGAHLVVCNSHGTAHALNRLGISHTIVAPNGFDPRLFKEDHFSRSSLKLPEGFLALYIGSEQSWKGIDVFRAAAAHVPDVTFAVVGGKEAKIIGNRVEVGKVPPRAVPDYLLSADVLVLPNTADSEESVSYTSPIKLFEYLAAGKPIIASDLPSIREILSDETARFVPPGNARELAHAIQELQDNPDERARLAHAAARQAREYTWRRRAERVAAGLVAAI